MRNPIRLLALALSVPSLLLPACQTGEAETGAAAVELRFVDARGTDLRGVLSGVVDTIVVRVQEGTSTIAQGAFDYEDLGGTLEDIPAGTERVFQVEASGSGTVIYAGETTGVTIVGGGLVHVPVNLSPAYGVDLYPPAAVDSLQAHVVGEQVPLDWLASGDDGLLGRADHYDIRVSDVEITEAGFSAAAAIAGAPVPGEPGSAETLTVAGLAGGTKHFALKVVDENGNASALSNRVSVELSVTSDVVAPAAVTDLQAQANDDDTVTLSWTATADDGDDPLSGAVSEVSIRMSTQAIDAGNFEQATPVSGPLSPAAPGQIETVLVEGLTTGQSLFFAVRLADEVPNWSGVASTGPVLVIDETAPGVVSDLQVEATGDESVLLRWTAPGDNGQQGVVSTYQVRRSFVAIDASNFAAAMTVDGPAEPLAEAGQEQTLAVSGLLPDTLYHFALRAEDDAGLLSEVSNDALVRTDDVLPPAQVDDLFVTSQGSDSVSLSWTAPADDGSDAASGPVSAYDLRYAAGEILDQASFDAATTLPGPEILVAPGQTQTVDLSGLPVGHWHFALVALDNRDNPSLISNSVLACVGCPQVLRLSPDSLPVGGVLHISGLDFGANAGSVELGGQAATVLAWSETMVRVEVPALVGGQGALDLVLSAESGLQADVQVGAFQLRPYVDALVLNAGVVTLTGTGFGPSQGSSSLVFAGSVEAPIVNSWTDQSIEVQLPGDAQSGPVQVVLDGLSSNGLELIVPGQERAWAATPALWRGGSAPGAARAAASAEGQALVAWTELVSVNREAFAQHDDGSAWGAAARISTANLDLGGYPLEIISDADGLFHLAWTEVSGDLRCRHVADGTFLAFETIGTGASGAQVAFGQLADGNLMAAWSSADGTSILANAQAGGVFSAASAVTVDNSLSQAAHLTAAVDPAGLFHVAAAVEGGILHLIYDGALWSDGGLITTTTSDSSLVVLEMAADSRGWLHLAWWDDAQVHTAHWNGALWSSAGGLALSSPSGVRPSLLVDAGDVVHLALSESATNTDVAHYIMDPQGSWSAGVRLSTSAEMSLQPALIVYPDLRALVIWEEAGELLSLSRQ